MKYSVVFILTLFLCKFLPMCVALRCHTCNFGDSFAVPHKYESGAIVECSKVTEEKTCEANQNFCIRMMTEEKLFRSVYYVYQKGCSYADCETIAKNMSLSKINSLLSCRECVRDGCNMWNDLFDYTRCHTCNFESFGVPYTSESEAKKECKMLEEEETCETSKITCLSAMTTVMEGVDKGKYVYRKGCSSYDCDSTKKKDLPLGFEYGSLVSCNECRGNLCNKWDDTNYGSYLKCHTCNIEGFGEFESQAKERCKSLEKEETCDADQTICLSAMIKNVHKGKYRYYKGCSYDDCDTIKKRDSVEIISCNDCRSDLCNKWSDSNNARRCYKCNVEVDQKAASESEAKEECKKSERVGICPANENFCISMMAKATGINKGKYMYMKDCWYKDCNALKKVTSSDFEMVSCYHCGSDLCNKWDARRDDNNTRNNGSNKVNNEGKFLLFVLIGLLLYTQ